MRAEIISARKLAKVEQLKRSNKETAPLYEQLEARVVELRKEWLDAVSSWETLRAESKLMQRANSTYEELRKEIQQAKTVVNERKQAFLNAVELLNAQGFEYAQ